MQGSEAMTDLKEGHKVICVDANGNPALKQGEKYTIACVIRNGGNAAVQLVGLGDDRFYPHRFERVE